MGDPRGSLPAGHRLNGKYQIIDRLGQGGFGMTYKALGLEDQAEYVIKEHFPEHLSVRAPDSTVRPAWDDRETRRIFDKGLGYFFAEAQLLQQMRHPNIVKVSGLFQENGTAYYVMPYQRGRTLLDLINGKRAEKGRFSEDELLDIFIPLLEGLIYIHGLNLLHRDIKPENILITAGKVPLLIDFGSARFLIGKNTTQLSKLICSEHYSPIEQYETKENFDKPLDLYSLAASLYTCLTLERPLSAAARAVEDRLPKLSRSDFTKVYSPHFLLAVDKSLSIQAVDRHQNGRGFQDDLLGWNLQSPPPPSGLEADDPWAGLDRLMDRYCADGFITPLRVEQLMRGARQAGLDEALVRDHINRRAVNLGLFYRLSLDEEQPPTPGGQDGPKELVKTPTEIEKSLKGGYDQPAVELVNQTGRPKSLWKRLFGRLLGARNPG